MFQNILISQRFGGGGKYPQSHRREEHTGAESQEHSQEAITSGAPVDRVYIFIKIHSSILAGPYIKTRMPPSLIRFSVLQDVRTHKSQALPVRIWGIKINQGVKSKSQQMTHLSALHRHVSGVATWPRVPACVRERGTWTFSLSTASSLLQERGKKTLKGRNRKLEGQHGPPKTIQESGEKANEEGTKE